MCGLKPLLAVLSDCTCKPSTACSLMPKIPGAIKSRWEYATFYRLSEARPHAPVKCSFQTQRCP